MACASWIGGRWTDAARRIAVARRAKRLDLVPWFAIDVRWGGAGRGCAFAPQALAIEAGSPFS
jgi:hypothetical protein